MNLRSLILVCLLTAPVVAQAAEPKHRTAQPNTSTLALSAVALNAAAGSLTFALVLPQGYAHAVFYVEFTHNNNGALTLTCTVSDDANTTDFTPTTCANAAGTCTLQWAGIWVTPSLSADKNYAINAGVLGYRDLECVFSHGGAADASDLVTITYDLITQ